MHFQALKEKIDLKAILKRLLARTQRASDASKIQEKENVSDEK
jgi:hypothetical protein